MQLKKVFLFVRTADKHVPLFVRIQRKSIVRVRTERIEDGAAGYSRSQRLVHSTQKYGNSRLGARNRSNARRRPVDSVLPLCTK